MERRTGGTWGRFLAVVLATVGLTAVAASPTASIALAVVAVPVNDRALLSLVLWICAGAGAVGAVGWAGATFVVPSLSATTVLGVGLAFGGGLGGLAHFLITGEAESPRDETMTVEMDKERTEPQPVDLFEASPDPLLYYDGDEPVVRAVNPAFEETFGASTAAVSEAPLGDALMVTDGADRVVAAAREGEDFDETVDCETTEGTAQFRVRLATVDAGNAGRGYVLYTPRSQQ